MYFVIVNGIDFSHSQKKCRTTLSITLKGRTLTPVHEAILPKLKAMKTFPLVMRDSVLECVGLGLHSLEIESLAQESFFVLQHTENMNFLISSWLEHLWQGLCRFNIQMILSQDIIRSSKQRNGRYIILKEIKTIFFINQRVAINRV